MLDSNLYLPGDTVLITDIEEFTNHIANEAGSSLVCVTSNVNTQCCRGSDGGNVGEWYFPDGTMVPRNSGARSADFTRSGFTRQVRLNRRNSAMSPTGTYECRVPDGDTGELVIASVTLATSGYMHALLIQTKVFLMPKLKCPIKEHACTYPCYSHQHTLVHT